jgi:heat shock protein HslJ
MAGRVQSPRRASKRLMVISFMAAAILAAAIVVWANGVSADREATESDQNTGTQPMTVNNANSLDGKWIITKAANVELRNDHEMSLEITDGGVYGIGPCNDFSTEVRTNDGNLNFMPINVGGESCDTKAMRQEQDFIQNLKRVSRYEILDGELVLYMIDTEVLRARKAP